MSESSANPLPFLVAPRKPSRLRRSGAAVVDYIVDVLTAVQAGREQRPVMSAFKG